MSKDRIFFLGQVVEVIGGATAVWLRIWDLEEEIGRRFKVPMGTDVLLGELLRVEFESGNEVDAQLTQIDESSLPAGLNQVMNCPKRKPVGLKGMESCHAEQLSVQI